MSFSCPHLNFDGHLCLKLTGPCSPGRKGCQVQKKVSFPARTPAAAPPPSGQALKSEFPRRKKP